MLVEGVHERDEAPGLGLPVGAEQRDVADEDGVEEPADLQVVAGS